MKFQISRNIRMALHAVVYRDKEHLELGHDEERTKVVPETGEVYLGNDKLSKKCRNKREAAAHRLGNSAPIRALSDEVSQLRGSKSFLERKILYSGTHSADAIPLQELDELSAELNRIRETGRSSAHMRELVSAPEQLIDGTKYESNPKVFG